MLPPAGRSSVTGPARGRRRLRTASAAAVTWPSRAPLNRKLTAYWPPLYRTPPTPPGGWVCGTRCLTGGPGTHKMSSVSYVCFVFSSSLHYCHLVKLSDVTVLSSHVTAYDQYSSRLQPVQLYDDAARCVRMVRLGSDVYGAWEPEACTTTLPFICQCRKQHTAGNTCTRLKPV